MKILITGSEGLLGSALKHYTSKHEFIFNNHNNFDLLNPKKVKIMMEIYRPDCVIHCAAKVGGIKINSEKPETMFYENMMMSLNVIHYAALNGVKKFISFGSTCAFEPTLSEIGEDNILSGQPYEKNAAYGYAKRMIYPNLLAAEKEYGMEHQYLVLASMFGENDNFNIDDGHVIPSLIHKCHVNKELRVWGTGAPKRQVLYSHDVARIVMGSVDSNWTGSVVVGSRTEVSVKQMVETIAKYMNFKGEIIWETDKPDGQLSRPLAKPYKDFTYTPFEEAIEKTCTWFKANYPNVRM